MRATALNERARAGVVLAVFLVIACLALDLPRAAAGGRDVKGRATGLIERTESFDPELPNYDIREDGSDAAADAMRRFREASFTDASAVADIRQRMVQGEADLRARVPDAKVEYNTDLRTPEVIAPDVSKPEPAFLTGPSNKRRPEILRDLIKENAELIGISSADADRLTVTADYTNPGGNMSFTHFEQTINGVPVFRGEIKAGFTHDNRIVRVINGLAPGIEEKRVAADFGDPAAAVKAAYANLRRPAGDLPAEDVRSNGIKVYFGRGDRATTAEKMYFPTEPGVAVPAWRVLIWQEVNAFYVIVDAAGGEVLWRKNIAEDQTQSATYNVYTANNLLQSADSPAPFSPGPINPTLGTQAPVISRTNMTLIGNEGSLSFNNNGWITDGINVTDGNANAAGIDASAPDGIDATQTGSPNRVFDTSGPAWNPPPGNPAPGDAPTTTQARRGAVIHMFYVMNRYHDEMYKLGFTEPARNFQHDNFGRGGVGADRVSSEGQDSSGTNNANFFTPADGARGIMQMYVWTGPTPDYDGTADTDIIIHEVTHGTSNRLVGNAAGLSTNMSRGMGEGWSDFYAHTMLSEPTDTINGVYSMGGYATYLGTTGYTSNYYHGIRRFPKAVRSFTGGPGSRPHNPLTFADVDSLDFNISDGAYARGPFGSATVDQVHNLGEIWSTALWEVRCLMVARLGHAAGTQRALQVVTDGLKLTPNGPTFLQARDAIISAASALPVAPEAAADAADVREGFRIRGMGAFATIENIGTGANNTRVTEDFHLNNVFVTNPFSAVESVGDGDSIPEPGEYVDLSVAVTNTTGAAVNNVTANVLGFPSSSYGNIANGATVTQQLTYYVPAGAPCGQHTVTIEVDSSVGAQAPEQKSFMLGATVPTGTAESFDGVTAPALPAGWTQTNSGGQAAWVTSTTTPDTAPNAAFGNDGASAGESSLITPSLSVPSNGMTVTFRRYNAFETPNWDGMVLEISINGGAYQDILSAGGSFTAGGYNGTIASGSSNPLGGRQGWIGTTSGAYVTTTATLPASANGQNVNLRWRIGADITIGAEGARIDGVSYTTVSCFAPTASRVQVAGRVFAPTGFPLANAVVTLTDQQGNVLSARTNNFGYYSISDVRVGETYVISAVSRGLVFAPRPVTINEDLFDLDLYFED